MRGWSDCRFPFKSPVHTADTNGMTFPNIPPPPRDIIKEHFERTEKMLNEIYSDTITLEDIMDKMEAFRETYQEVSRGVEKVNTFMLHWVILTGIMACVSTGAAIVAVIVAILK